MKRLIGVVPALAIALVSVPTALGGGAPGVTFVTPKPNAVVHAGAVTFQVRLTNFTIDPQDVGKRPIAGKGHLHFQMDGGKYDFPRYSGANGKLAVKLGIQGKYSPSVAPTITYKGLPKGWHTLMVMLAKNNHAPYGNTGATAKVRFMVE
jgi:hypothetical protein